jgi:hypothetical protein
VVRCIKVTCSVLILVLQVPQNGSLSMVQEDSTIKMSTNGHDVFPNNNQRNADKYAYTMHSSNEETGF